MASWSYPSVSPKHSAQSEPHRGECREPGSLIRNAGIIRFESTADRATRVHLLMFYDPPSGALGHALATLFGVEPKTILDEDLARMQSLFEHGKTTAHGRTVTRDQMLA